MSNDQFKKYAEAYGSDMRRWPEQAQRDHAVFADTTEGRSLLAEAERIDIALRGYQCDMDISARLTSRIHAIATQPDNQVDATAGWEKGFFRFSAMSLAACLVLGLFVGLLSGYEAASGSMTLDKAVDGAYGASFSDGVI